MPNEVQWQHKIIKRVKSEGGWGRKWSSTYAVGVPDLLLAHPNFGLIAVEVKLEKLWVKDTARTMNLSDIQIKTLNDMFLASARVCALVVVTKMERGHADLYVMFPRFDTGGLTMKKQSFVGDPYDWRKDKLPFTTWIGDKFNVRDNFRR